MYTGYAYHTDSYSGSSGDEFHLEAGWATLVCGCGSNADPNAALSAQLRIKKWN